MFLHNGENSLEVLACLVELLSGGVEVSQVEFSSDQQIGRLGNGVCERLLLQERSFGIHELFVALVGQSQEPDSLALRHFVPGIATVFNHFREMVDCFFVIAQRSIAATMRKK